VAWRRIWDVHAVSTSLPGLPGARPAARPDFAAVAEASLDGVYRYLLYLTRDASLAEDLTGETFERALRSWRRYDPRRGEPIGWLCRIARSAALDRFRADERRRARERRYASAAEDASETPFVEGLSPELERALSGLSAADREVIVLRVVLELEAAETARLLGISATACTTRLNRALQRLEDRMESNALA
jgi:RNA polymerase sigma-70 factor (ECF subfamily)